ncbi:peptidase [Enterococcus gallinarum]|uniref:Peptidase n=1 Tax=Enterococcus gallinarum TaxID=1353 RepID=A0ABD4HMU9_ENTGA|nr:peptidase [Enterococcus gallinarum]MBA0947964.1 peptidase [Enterococcus gallinarum]MBA0961543.1 peptidase [Enterococcus gallinarum]MBA0969456.1 peptidase [Enterococcus gallinarum]MBA0972743.1 peptidase [Enterococcus gallinarum]NVI96317.1 peptidase [Enterococcus gallinarum]
MKKWGKYFSLLGVLLVGLSTFVCAGTSVYAAEETTEMNQQLKNELVDELTFYFETVGSFDEDGVYHVNDLNAIHERINQNTEEGIAAKAFYEQIVVPSLQRVNWKKYAGCVVINSLPGGGVAWALGTAASAQSGFIEALKAFNFEKAADILIKIAEKQLGKAAAKELAKVNVVAEIATAAVSCAME